MTIAFNRAPSALTVLRCVIAPAVAAIFSACGTYEEPKPGIYRLGAETQSELICATEAPTGMLIASTRCRRADDVSRVKRESTELLESLRMPSPREP